MCFGFAMRRAACIHTKGYFPILCFPARYKDGYRTPSTENVDRSTNTYIKAASSPPSSVAVRQRLVAFSAPSHVCTARSFQLFVVIRYCCDQSRNPQSNLTNLWQCFQGSPPCSCPPAPTVQGKILRSCSAPCTGPCSSNPCESFESLYGCRKLIVS